MEKARRTIYGSLKWVALLKRRQLVLSEFILPLLLLAVYIFFAIRWGMRFVDGRWAWLEKPNHKAIKIIVAIISGYFLVGFYLIFRCVKLVVIDLPKWLS